MTTADDAVIGTTGKEGPRVDFNLKRFDDLVERSPRFVWERAMFCPCPSVNDQTQQPDPNCTKCKGVGWLWFGPAGYIPPPAAGTLNPVQMAVVNRNGGAVIRAFMAEATYRQAGYDTLGTWAFGQMHVIVVTSVQSSTSDYLEGRDFEVTGGDIVWLAGRAPAAGIQLAAHYTCHPAWILTSYPHVIRATVNDRKPKKPVTSPAGNPQNLPIRGRVQLEFEREG